MHVSIKLAFSFQRRDLPVDNFFREPF